MCFSLEAIKWDLLWLLGICFVIGILKIVVPWILSAAEVVVDARAYKIINLAVLVVIIAATIFGVFWLLECAFYGGNLRRY